MSAPDVKLEAAAGRHILVVDDDAGIRNLLKRYLLRVGFRVSAAQNAAEARRLVGGLDFDLIVLDIMMPGESGVALTRWITGRTPVLLLTARGDTESRIEGLEAGADDYLAKPFEPRELTLRIEAILRRGAAKPHAGTEPRVQLGDDAYFDPARGELWRDGAEIRLTTAEIVLMRILAKHANTPLSRAALLGAINAVGADTLEPDEPAVQDRAVDVQITRLRKKVERNPKAPRFVKTVRGAGYMLTPGA